MYVSIAPHNHIATPQIEVRSAALYSVEIDESGIVLYSSKPNCDVTRIFFPRTACLSFNVEVK